MNAAIKVLIVDDEPPIRKLLRMGLSTQGYDILEASNGKIALELLAQTPALIILDLGLPDIQGHDLLRMIRARDESVPIVVLSSFRSRAFGPTRSSRARPSSPARWRNCATRSRPLACWCRSSCASGPAASS